MSKKSLGIVGVIIVVGLAGTYFFWQQYHDSNSGLESISRITTPAGWYSWGETNYPDYPHHSDGSSTGVVLTFGDQPLDEHGNLHAAVINIHADAAVKTQEQWLSKLSATLASLSCTSTQSWETINGIRVLKAQTTTPAGGYNLSYFFFNNGVEWSFNFEPSFIGALSPEYSSTNIASSTGALALRSMVLQFVQSLPSRSAE